MAPCMNRVPRNQPRFIGAARLQLAPHGQVPPWIPSLTQSLRCLTSAPWAACSRFFPEPWSGNAISLRCFQTAPTYWDRSHHVADVIDDPCLSRKNESKNFDYKEVFTIHG